LCTNNCDTNSISNLNIFYQNVRGLRCKLDLIRDNIPVFGEYDVAILSKIWFIPDFINSEFGFSNFSVLRLDRNISYEFTIYLCLLTYYRKSSLKCPLTMFELTLLITFQLCLLPSAIITPCTGCLGWPMNCDLSWFSHLICLYHTITKICTVINFYLNMYILYTFL